MISQNFNKYLLLFLIFSTSQLIAQPVEELVPISARPQQSFSLHLNKKKAATGLSLPVKDDFSYRHSYPDTLIWEDHNVYVNYTYGIAPPTLGVATFDGLDKDGLPYDITSLATDTCDVLTSRPIDLSNPTGSVYLSFFWQAGGLGEKPESNDSLNLQFYSPQLKSWQRVWGVRGVDSTKFEQVMIPVTGSAYLRDGFRFRFMSFGARAGAFDTWNLDYVQLGDQRTAMDTAFTDPAFTRPHPSLLKDFTAVPWFHYNSTLASAQNKQILDLYYQRNLKPGQTLNLNLCVYQISYQGNILASNPTGDPTKDNGHVNGVETYFDEPIGNFQLPSPPVDEFEITAISTYTGTSIASKGPNDTIIQHQLFKNYYALDDGTAERAYQVRDNAGGFILSKYDIAQPDEIKGLYIYFLPSQYDVEQNQFRIVIYENSNGLPGKLLYRSDSLYTPRYTSTNFFLPYVLDTAGVPVSGPVLMGIEQKNNTRLPVGFDMSSGKKNRIFYGSAGNFYESYLKGNLMMRPFLRYLPKDLTLPEMQRPGVQVNIYPNPARDLLHVQTSGQGEELNYYINNISGQLIKAGKLSSEISLGSHFTPGIYLLRVEDPSGQKAPATFKLMIER